MRMKILPHFKYPQICFTLASFNHFVSHFSTYYHFLRGAKELKFKLSFATSQLLYFKNKQTNKNWKGMSRVLKTNDFHF